jgi:hypothetical protein
MALKPGSVVKTGDYLKTNDYIQSPSGFFFAIQQSDGNFCVYHGSGPDDNHGYVWGSQQTAPGGEFFAIQQSDANFCTYKGTDPAHNDGGLWCSMHTAPEGQYFAVMQDDGNFCVYKGTGLADNHGGVWCSMHTDPVANFEINHIEYDVANAQTLQSGPAELFRQTVTNHTTSPQTSTISGSQAVTETSGWSDSLGISVGVKTTFECGVPLVAEGKVEVSATASNTYTWNGSESRSKTWSWSTPVTVPPGGVSSVIVGAMMSTMAVPYTLSGTVVFTSGVQMPGHVKGLYTGTNSHDLTATFAQLDAAGQVSVQNTPQ